MNNGILGGIGSILEPLALGGVMAYQTYQDGEIKKADSKARRAELAQIAAIRQQESEMKASLAPLQTKQVQYVVGGIAVLGGLGIASYLILKLASRGR